MSWRESRLVSLLEERYGITDISNEGRTTCPRCNGSNLFIKRNGEIATCWNCGLVLFHDQRPDAPDIPSGAVADAWMSIMMEFHAVLLSQVAEDVPSKNARSYLEIDRKINPKVTASLREIGAIRSDWTVAEWDDWAKQKFSVVDTELDVDAAAEAAEFPEDKKKKKGYKDWARRRLERWRAAKDEFMYKITAVPQNERQRLDRSRAVAQGNPVAGNCFGFLALWYADNKGRPTGIKFWCPKLGTKYRPAVWFSKTRHGVFGNSVFSTASNDGDNLLVVEGEMNALQVQSLLATVGSDFGNVVAVGSSSSIDVDTVLSESGNIVVCYDHDKPTVQYPKGVGWSVVDKLRQKRTIKHFTTPTEGSDADSWILDELKKGTPLEAAQKLVQMIKCAKPIYRPHEAVFEETKPFRSGSDLAGNSIPAWEAKRKVCEIIINDLTERGAFYRDQKGAMVWYFDNETKRLSVITYNNPNITVMLSNYGTTDADEIHRQIYGHLRAHALKHGTVVEPKMFSHHISPQCGENAVHVYNGGDVFRITKDKVEIVDNGSYGVLFQHDDRFVNLDISIDEIEAQRGCTALRTFRDIVTSTFSYSQFNKITPGMLSWLVEGMFLGMFFGDMFPAKPILAVLGEPGSGKSFCVKKILIALNGHSGYLSAMPKKQDDFYTMVGRSGPLHALDNVDTDAPPWFQDSLAGVATGRTFVARKLYSDMDAVEIEPKIWMAVTAYRPTVFRRVDIADRLLIVDLERYPNSQQTEQDIVEEVLQNRKQMWVETINVVREMLAVMYCGKQRVQPRIKPQSDYRMRTFRDFTMMFAQINFVDADVEQAFAYIGDVQKSFALGSDRIYELLSDWASTRSTGSLYMNGENWTTSSEISRALAEMADSRRIKMRTISARFLSEWVLQNKSSLVHMLGIEIRSIPGRPNEYKFTKLNNQIQ